MRCSKCGFENPTRMKFCGQCTAPLALVCPKCHSENPPGFKFCGQCTTVLERATSAPSPRNPPLRVAEADEAAALEGERKTVTVLFADIKGSMELYDFVERTGIREPLLDLVPYIQFNYSQAFIASRLTTSPDFRWTPGMAYLGDTFEISLGPQLALNGAHASGDHVVLLGLVEIFYDEIFPSLSWNPF